jgi:predicted AlkP superfamily pyrophosphatase or phosphodiesterase
VTGADTAAHGIAGNEWLNRATGKPIYCTFDPSYPIVGDPPREAGGGMSPANLTSTTIGDELVNASGGRSRAFAVAGKDRSSIIPGGHRGKAFWYSEESGGFVSSAYYFSALPEWATQWNAKRPVQDYRTRLWNLSRDPGSYRYAGGSGNPHARPHRSVGQSFPHSPQSAVDKEFYSMLRFTPMLDEHTASFVRELIAREEVGQRGPVDYLSVSFSATDYVGHTYGPNSVEYEDNLIRLDATLAALFAYVDQKIGAGRTIVVLSADHGADDIPEHRALDHYDADRLASQAAIRDGASAFLKSRLNSSENFVVNYVPPGLYLDHTKLTQAKVDVRLAENALAEYGRTIPGIAFALTRSDLISGNVARTPLMNRIERGFHPERSGDVVLIQKQFWYMDTLPTRYAATHGSPYNYDTHVPVIFYGPGIQRAQIARDVEPGSIAPTLAALLRISPPSGSTAATLLEVIPAR